ncbi:MAG: hypothetical protein HOK21_23435 [Rhodospirillaceae bacterium]|jgi:chemotaxis regulatin CheY-phosphate phosphatase CheZ|nr:hypothetical protein [Rhodospirillaceae bacterium]MBT4046110.1 hypothetical protein [Rhodospirillaceae bacterium]MBT4687855.1 hypothetical protein [Rhodospirillaceae bacterium]MBT5081610.1 hypothetical protein [Rhodospirillaceae bacterium]MBT5527052.1 hypothetical protein [Rhodospirillaceae bacterium]
MSMQSEPITAELDALPENPAFDEEPVFDHEIESTDDELENRRELTHDEYDSLEEAVMQTARGRTFLREHARRNRAIASDLVMRALDDMRSQPQQQDLKQPSEILSAELQNMSDAIAHTRRDIAAIKPKEGANNRIMAATEDLDAIVTATERATNDILAAAENIQENFEKLRESIPDSDLFDAIEEDITNIFLACSFQDITGQRTTKVVNALRYLEQRVGAMIQIWGSETLRNGALEEFSANNLPEDHPEAGLLNGPQMDGQGVAQADIDAMMNGGSDLTADSNDDDAAAGLDPEDPTAGIDFDSVTTSMDDDAPVAADPEDPKAGIDFDSVARSLDDDAPDTFDGLESGDGSGSDGLDEEIAELSALDDANPDEMDFSGLSEEADADTIDAIFNS